MQSYQAIKDMAWKWNLENCNLIKDCPPEVKFITGNQQTDAAWHYFQIDSGLDITLSEDLKNFEELKVVNEEKFAMFSLRWS
jgi:hypothetical protein